MYLSIDIGGSQIKYGLLEAHGKVIEKDKVKTPKTNLAAFINAIDQVIKPYLGRIKGIAFSCPGIIDIEQGIIHEGGALPFLDQLNMVHYIKETYDLPSAIENDGKCAALAELWSGHIKGAQTAVVMVLGTGVGGGIVTGGKLHRGAHLQAGEFSFLLNDVNYADQSTVSAGMKASSVRMVKRIGRALHLPEPIDGKEVFEQIEAGKELAKRLFEEYCLDIAVQLYNLQYILDPEVIAIGGGISVQPILLKQIKQAIKSIHIANPAHTANINVVSCKYLNDANLIGALYHLLETGQREG